MIRIRFKRASDKGSHDENYTTMEFENPDALWAFLRQDFEQGRKIAGWVDGVLGFVLLYSDVEGIDFDVELYDYYIE